MEQYGGGLHPAVENNRLTTMMMMRDISYHIIHFNRIQRIFQAFLSLIWTILFVTQTIPVGLNEKSLDNRLYQIKTV